MADKKWETVYYAFKSGTFKFRFWYGDPAGTDGATTDIDLRIKDFSPVKVPMDVLPGESYQFASTKVTFLKHLSLENMLNDVIENSKETHLFFDIVTISGKVVWRGLTDIPGVQKADYFISGTDFDYKKITFPIFGAMWYFHINKESIPASIVLDYRLLFSEYFEYICGKIGLSYPDDVENFQVCDFLDTDFFATGISKYNFSTDMFLYLKGAMTCFAVYVVFLDGKLHIISRCDGDNIITSLSDKFWEIKQEADQNEDIRYFEISCKLDVLNPDGATPGKMLKTTLGSAADLPGYSEVKHRLDDLWGKYAEYGLGEEETLGLTSFDTINISEVSGYDNGDWQIVDDTEAESEDITTIQVITITTTSVVDLTEYAKEGYTVHIYNSSSELLVSGIVAKVVSASEMKIISLVDDMTNANYFRICKNTPSPGGHSRNRGFGLFQHMHDRYSQFIGNPVFRFVKKGLEFSPKTKILMNGEEYKVRYISLDFLKNRTVLKAHRLGAISTETGYFDEDYFDSDYFE